MGFKSSDDGPRRRNVDGDRIWSGGGRCSSRCLLKTFAGETSSSSDATSLRSKTVASVTTRNEWLRRIASRPSVADAVDGLKTFSRGDVTNWFKSGRGAAATNRCNSKAETSGRNFGSRSKHKTRKSWPALPNDEGISGNSSTQAI